MQNTISKVLDSIKSPLTTSCRTTPTMASQWKIDVVIANRYTRSFELTPTIALDAVLEVDESDVTPGPYHGHRISAEAKYKAVSLNPSSIHNSSTNIHVGIRLTIPSWRL